MPSTDTQLQAWLQAKWVTFGKQTRINSRKCRRERDATVAEAGEWHNLFTQWNTVLFATVRFTVIFKCLHKNQKVQTNPSWSSLRAHLIETSTFAICATTRSVLIVPSTKIPDTATLVMQGSMGTTLPISHETQAKRIFPCIYADAFEKKRFVFVADVDCDREADIRKAYTDMYRMELEDVKFLQISPVSRLYHNGVEKQYCIQLVEK